MSLTRTDASGRPVVVATNYEGTTRGGGLTPAERAQMDRAADDVRKAFEKASLPVYQASVSFLSTDASRAVWKQLSDQSVRAQNWATKERAQVEAGEVSLKWWLEAGRTYATYAASTVGDAVNGSLYTVLESTVKETARTVATPLVPSLWPKWAPWAVGGLALVLVLAVGAPYARVLAK